MADTSMLQDFQLSTNLSLNRQPSPYFERGNLEQRSLDAYGARLSSSSEQAVFIFFAFVPLIVAFFRWREPSVAVSPSSPGSNHRDAINIIVTPAQARTILVKTGTKLRDCEALADMSKLHLCGRQRIGAGWLAHRHELRTKREP
jgi:hypothetical protein